ncbi:diiron oxygenase [Aldersonia kunmingensis]|uniref:diiron oxygenase n=1 Tax=Aldersonia kunmingensis TaxID=408066 RepID=UPI00082DB5C8|nr:diiron oxygenase [Aldersonia kunmingensis]
MADGEIRFHRPYTVTGGPVLRRRSVADRQKAAQQLLFAAAEETYDGELDVDWDRSPTVGSPWIPDELVSVYGTRLWRSLNRQQQVELGRRELVVLLTAAMYLENAASMLTFRSAMEERALADDRTRFQLAMINDRARNVTMFSRLVNRIGVEPYLRPGLSNRFARVLLMSPNGPFAKVLGLLADEFVDALAHPVAARPDLQPHVRQVMTVHSASRQLHIRYGWDELGDAMSRGLPSWRRVQEVLAAALIVSLGPLSLDSRAYRDIGIGRARGLWSAYTSRQYRARMESLTGVLVSSCIDAGMYRGLVARSILRAGRCLPKAEADEEQRG